MWVNELSDIVIYSRHNDINIVLKPRADFTRSPKQGYQWPYKKDLCPTKILKKTQFFRTNFWVISYGTHTWGLQIYSQALLIKTKSGSNLWFVKKGVMSPTWCPQLCWSEYFAIWSSFLPNWPCVTLIFTTCGVLTYFWKQVTPPNVVILSQLTFWANLWSLISACTGNLPMCLQVLLLDS